MAGCLLGFFGFRWDIVAHGVFRRDSFWSAPHVLMLLGIALGLIGGVWLLRTRRGAARRGGWVIALAAAGQLAVLPVDNLWHELYGLDNTLWSLPHLLYILSGSVAPLGLALALGQLRPPAAPALQLTWEPRALLRVPALPLFGLFLGWLDFTLVEFHLAVPPPYWPWDFALFPPLMIGIALLASFTAVGATRLVGAVTVVCFAFMLLGLAVDAELLALRLFWLPAVPLLVPSAALADVLLAGPARWPLRVRVILAAAAFGAVFYAVQYPYSALVARTVFHLGPAWTPRVLADGWVFALVLALLAAPAGLALGHALRQWPCRGSRPRAVAPAPARG